MRTTARIGTVWCLLVLALTAGCDGGAARLSAPDYVHRSSRICVHANVAVARSSVERRRSLGARGMTSCRGPALTTDLVRSA